jgi:cathepsin L
MEDGFHLISRRAAVSGILAAIQPMLLSPTLSSAIAQAAPSVSTHSRGCRVPSDIGKRIHVQNAASAELEQLINSNPVLRDALKEVRPTAPLQPLPRFDWREKNRVTPVRDQGPCGSCWIFATLGVYESAYLIANPKEDSTTLHVNEQQMLDCNFPEANCTGGFHDNALIYLQYYGLTDWDPNYRYNPLAPARGSYCNANYGDRPYYPRNWGYVPSSTLIPTDAEIKHAITSYGPIISAVIAGKNWDNYDNDKGVLKGTTPNDNDPQKKVNHEVAIVGWDDKMQGAELPAGAWIVKNSWGENWGDKGGYVYVPYGRENIGFTASWVTAWPNKSSVLSAVSDLAQMKLMK